MLAYRHLCACLIVCLLPAAAGARTPSPVASPPRAVQLTIYNDGFALVKEEREVELGPGVSSVLARGVSAQIDPTSVSLLPLDRDPLVIREQSYRYDLLNPVTVLNKAVGKPVSIRLSRSGEAGQTITGTLLNPATAILPATARMGDYGPSYNYTTGYPQDLGGLVVKTDQGLAVALARMTYSEGVVVELPADSLPPNLVSEPQLSWLVEGKAGVHPCRLTYLTDLIGWSADYTAVVDAAERLVDLGGWVTVTNQSGATYPNATLQLMAGDVRRIRPEPAGRSYSRFAAKAAAAPDGGQPQFEQQPFFEYHLYTLSGRTTVADKETKQMRLLQATGVPVSKGYVFEPGRADWQRWLNRRMGDDYSVYPRGQAVATSPVKTVGVVLTMKNTKPNRLGMPLPAGKVRLYKADREGRLQFIGEDEIRHTPVDEAVRLTVGNAFDIVGERKRTELKIADNNREYTERIEITLRNHKAEPVTVSVLEHPLADWEMVEKSQEYKKIDANTIEFAVPVPAQGEAVVAYRVHVVH